MVVAPNNPPLRMRRAFIALTLVACLSLSIWFATAYKVELHGLTFSNRSGQDLTVEWVLTDDRGRQLARSFTLARGGTYHEENVTSVPGKYTLQVEAGITLRDSAVIRFEGSCDPRITFTNSDVRFFLCGR